MKQTLWILVVLAFATGCGGANQASSEPAATASAPESSPSLAQDAVWDDLDFNGRREFMVKVVMPEMKPLLSEDGAAFGCKNCHGEDQAEVNFKMPNTLDPLDPANMPFSSEDEAVRKAATFMSETVVPKMAGLLKEAPYDAATGQGFGCFNCHAKK